MNEMYSIGAQSIVLRSTPSFFGRRDELLNEVRRRDQYIRPNM
jgi:hypothetical protein